MIRKINFTKIGSHLIQARYCIMHAVYKLLMFVYVICCAINRGIYSVQVKPTI